MCAQFLIKRERDKWARLYGINLTDEDEQGIDERILPYKLAPVILDRGDGREGAEMRFSLLPSWSKEPRVKFATHNARLDTILEKPTWKKPFVSQRCLVPMDQFIEPIYDGTHAGYMVRFGDSQDRTMTAAGLWDSWVNKETGEIIESFAVITDDPPKYVAEIGHDRCPVFLQANAWDEWLSTDNEDGAELVKLLKSSREVFELEVENDRPMKAGWEKRK